MKAKYWKSAKVKDKGLSVSSLPPQVGTMLSQCGNVPGRPIR